MIQLPDKFFQVLLLIILVVLNVNFLLYAKSLDNGEYQLNQTIPYNYNHNTFSTVENLKFHVIDQAVISKNYKDMDKVFNIFFIITISITILYLVARILKITVVPYNIVLELDIIMLFSCFIIIYLLFNSCYYEVYCTYYNPFISIIKNIL